MSKQIDKEITPVKKPRGTPGSFKEGHKKVGGRPKGSMGKRSQYAFELAERMKVDPLTFMLEVVASTAVQVAAVNETTGEAVLNDDGTVKHVWVAVPLQTRLEAAKSLMSYLYPKLAATEISGADGGPVEVATLDVAEIMANPDLAKAAQQMALMLAEQAADTDNDAATLALRKREAGVLLPRE